ncbi:hypothetical protein SAMN05661044_03425 [Olivibacter domesticus]|uniref:Uncharacterized protein n=1 Tax=Olivibacter domesticus TaxID=407022 RepID=A0A1H7TAP0_OLID1|nr:hypothetical protein SAMN05661044_03425 [Olivibacter domesticus]
MHYVFISNNNVSEVFSYFSMLNEALQNCFVTAFKTHACSDFIAFQLVCPALSLLPVLPLHYRDYFLPP